MNILGLIAKWLPTILAGVVGVENVLKASPGATKKQIVLGVIEAGATAAGQTAPNAEVQAVGTLVDTVVGVLNQSGVFTSTPKPTA